MSNDQMAGSQAGNTWKGFQSSKFNIVTKGRELLPTMTLHTATTCEVMWPGDVH